MSYHLEYVDKPGKFDEVVEQDGVKVLIDSKALFSIIGSEMDWKEDALRCVDVHWFMLARFTDSSVAQSLLLTTLTSRMRVVAESRSLSTHDTLSLSRLWTFRSCVHIVDLIYNHPAIHLSDIRLVSI